jgi:antitoxin ParD1/3/4
MCNQAFSWLTRLAWQPLQSVKRPKSCDGSAFWLTPIWFVMIDPEGKGPPVPQGKRHSVDLTPDLENAIQRRLDSGAYKSDIEVIRAGLRALDRDDEERARRLAQLDASIARGIADADAGRVHPADQVFSELRQRIQQKADTRGR